MSAKPEPAFKPGSKAHARAIEQAVAGREDLVWLAMKYRCRRCGEVEWVYCGVGVEGPPDLRAQYLVIPSRRQLWGVDADRREFGEHHWNEPRRWNRRAEREGRRIKVFCASMADVFDKNAPLDGRSRLWRLIKETPFLDWQLLTKRIGNAPAMLPDDWGEGYPNAWLGISVVNQVEADRDIPKLLRIPARLRFLSCEPLLGPISFEGRWVDHPNPALHENWLEALDWLIAGGESGPRARPTEADWVRTLRDQCAAAGTAFFFKQWGNYLPAGQDGSPDHEPRIINASDQPLLTTKQAAGRLLDGREWKEFPQL